jgi:hypothetical protein
MIKKSLYILLIITLVASCKCKNNKAGFDTSDTASYDGNLPVDPKEIDNMVQNISSPVEMAALIKDMGVPFSRKYLASTDNVDNYNTSYKKAFCLGIYGADLGYLNMYNKTSSVIDYITAIKKLSDGINVGQFFDFNTLKRLATNNTNLDSLMYISVRSFNDMDTYLRKNKRSSLSVLMVTGVWVEGLYLATQVAKDFPTKEISQSIGEQKVIIEQLFIVLKNYNRDAEMVNVIKELETIKKDFESISITTVQGTPKQVEKNGMLTIEQNSTTEVHITNEQLKTIIGHTEQVRNKLLKP